MAKRILGIALAFGMAASLSACDTVGDAASSSWDWTKGAASATADFVTSPFQDDEDMSN